MNEELADLFADIYLMIASYGDEKLKGNYILCLEQMEAGKDWSARTDCLPQVNEKGFIFIDAATHAESAIRHIVAFMAEMQKIQEVSRRNRGEM